MRLNGAQIEVASFHSGANQQGQFTVGPRSLQLKRGDFIDFYGDDFEINDGNRSPRLQIIRMN